MLEFIIAIKSIILVTLCFGIGLVLAFISYINYRQSKQRYSRIYDVGMGRYDIEKISRDQYYLDEEVLLRESRAKLSGMGVSYMTEKLPEPETKTYDHYYSNLAAFRRQEPAMKKVYEYANPCQIVNILRTAA